LTQTRESSQALPAGYALPPQGSITKDNEAYATAFLDGLVVESEVRKQPLQPGADENLSDYLGHQWKLEAPDYYSQITVNRIQNAVIAQVAIQTEETPKSKFTPRESLEPPVYYLNTSLDTTPTPELQALLAVLPPEVKDTTIDAEGKEVPPRELLPDEVQLIEQAIDAAARNAALLPGTETTIPADILIGITDRIAAESLQTIFDAKWDECDADFAISENSLYNSIVGWQWLQYQFDDETFAHQLKNVPFLQVHVDPLATDVRDAQYVIFDQIMSADEAVAAYPDLETDIRRNATAGTIAPAGASYRQASIYGDVNFRREMIPVRTAWIRHNPKPLTPEEALAKGLITEKTEPIEEPMSCNCGMGLEMPVQDHDAECPCRMGYKSPMDKMAAMGQEALVTEVAEGESETLAEDGAAPVTPAPEMDEGQSLPPTSRVVGTKSIYTLVKTSEEVTPESPLWPSRPILRQLRAILSSIVDDRECEFADIPMCLNVNIPIPYSPYGMGEPERLRGLQTAINSVLSDMVTHWHFHAQPAEWVAQSANNSLPKQMQGLYTGAPGNKIVVPDDLLMRLQGKVAGYIDPPKIPSDGWQLLQLMLKLIDDEANNTEVMQGRASASWSGEAINSLQKAARGAIGWRSRRTEFVLKRLAKLMAFSIIHRMPIEIKKQYVTRFPPQVWNRLDAKMRTLEMDVSVEISSGGGAKKQKQEASDLSLFDRGLLSKTTMLESTNHDPKIESMNRMKEAAEDAVKQMPQQPVPAAPAQQVQPQEQEAPPAA
jgi:hypothetical protein